MPEHQIHWTALPRRADDTHVELDVFVSPRLGAGAPASEHKLSEFPELAGWTARVAAGEVAFDVSFDGGLPVAAVIVAQDPLDEDLWKHLFPPETPVEPWSFRDHSRRPIHSFPLRWIVAYLRDVYREVGRSSGPELPDADDLIRIRGPLGGIIDTRVKEEHDMSTERPGPGAGSSPGQPQGCLTAILAPLCRLLRPLCRRLRPLCRWLRRLFGGGAPGSTGGAKPAPEAVEYPYRPPAPRPDDPYAEIEAAIGAHGAVPPFELKGPKIAAELPRYPIELAFAQARLFYDRPEVQADKAPLVLPRWDFHRRLGALGDYPAIMQRLGLTIRLRAPRPAGAPATVRVVPRVGGHERPAVDLAPKTACRLDGERFYARPRDGSDLAEGMLDLGRVDDRLESSERRFDLVQVDADGAALKAIIAAASLERRRQVEEEELGSPAAAEEPEPLPSTRSAGFAVVRADRAWGLKGRLERVRARWTGPGDEPLYADDVVRGYQVWVKREGEGWLSLCKRRGIYRLVDEAGKLVGKREIEDLGYVKRSGATSKDGSSDLYLHEAIVRWTGWSLVAPPPGETIGKGEKKAAAVSKAPPELRLETRFSPSAGSLPRLRFGASYRFAMTWVDLAGQPLTQLADGPDDASPQVSAAVEYRRFEPLPPPSVLPFGEFTPGGSLERLVVRSDFDRSPSQWLADVDPGPTYAVHDERRLFAPKTSQLMAEQHGRFESAIGEHGDFAAGFDLGKREQGTFIKPAVSPFGEPDEPGQTVVNRDRDTVLVAPYLPDPLTAGILLRDVPNLTMAGGVEGDPLMPVEVPGVDNPVLRIPFGPGWPDLKSLRVRVAGGPPGAAPRWDAGKRLLTIHLDKGTEATVLYSCYLEPRDLGQMGVWDWIDDGGKAPAELRQQALQSIHWLIAPWRELTLVHAVQRPLRKPTLGPTFATRAAGETFATVAGPASADAASCGRIDLEASWEDWRDDLPGSTALVLEPHKANVGHWAHGEGVEMPPQRHEFGDTRHRMVRYRLRASSRFREYLPAGKKLKLTRTGPDRLVSVPASAPPDPPRISHAVPVFGWRHEEGPGDDAVLGVGETLRRTRLGGGLRVFLERPWYSSGEGERLAVVVPGPDEVPATLVSRAGSDPTVGESGGPRTRELEPAMFSGAEFWDAIPLSERPARVGIASYAPSFDPERGLWACDVALDMSALPWGDWPFVRLALARHQPDALADARLSKVQLAQWAQLAPDRRLRVTRTAADQVSVELRGRGRRAPEFNRLLVGVESAVGAAPDELDWRPVGGGTPPELDIGIWHAAKTPQPPHDEEELLWQDSISFHAIGGESLRLTVRELERRPGEGEGEVGRGAFRITYADAVRLA